MRPPLLPPCGGRRTTRRPSSRCSRKAVGGSRWSSSATRSGGASPWPWPPPARIWCVPWSSPPHPSSPDPAGAGAPPPPTGWPGGCTGGGWWATTGWSGPGSATDRPTTGRPRGSCATSSSGSSTESYDGAVGRPGLPGGARLGRRRRRGPGGRGRGGRRGGRRGHPYPLRGGRAPDPGVGPRRVAGGRRTGPRPTVTRPVTGTFSTVTGRP